MDKGGGGKVGSDEACDKGSTERKYMERVYLMNQIWKKHVK